MELTGDTDHQDMEDREMGFIHGRAQGIFVFQTNRLPTYSKSTLPRIDNTDHAADVA